MCFIYSVLAALMYEDGRVTNNFNNLSHYIDHVDELDYSGIQFPIDLEDIKLFEKKNKLSINVYGLNEKQNRVVPIRISKVENVKPINLFLLEKDEKSHYCWIKSFDGLFGNKKYSQYFCPYCLYGFSRNIRGKEKYDHHIEYCRKNNPARVSIPKKRTLKFNDHKKMLRSPFTIYGDFECLIKKKKMSIGDKTEIKAEHIPCGFSLVTTSSYSKFKRKEIRYRGPDTAKKFVEEVCKERNRLLKIIDKESRKPMKLTNEEKVAHEQAETCWICGEGGFTCENVPAMCKKVRRKKVRPSKRNKRKESHLDELGPFLLECGMDAKSKVFKNFLHMYSTYF